MQLSHTGSEEMLGKIKKSWGKLREVTELFLHLIQEDAIGFNSLRSRFHISRLFYFCPFRAYQRSFRLFQSDFSKDIHQWSRLLCFTQNDHTGQTGFKICPFLKWAQ